MSSKSKIVLAFFCCGLLAGLLGTRLLFSTPDLGSWFWAMGIIFMLGPFLGLLLARSRHWIRLKATSSIFRYIAAAVVAPLAWPVAFIGVLAGMFVCDRILRTLGPSLVEMPDFTILTLGLGMLLGALVSSGILGLALTILTDRWDFMGFLSLAGSGFLTVLATMFIYVWISHYWRAVFHASRDQIFFGSLLLTGMALFSASCGLWLLRSEALD